MLQTLHQIGKELSVGRDKWQDIIESKPPTQKEGINYYILSILFDLDKGEIIVSKDGLKVFDPSFAALKQLMYLKTLGRNMKSPYLCVANKKIENLYKTLFGKPDKKTGAFPKQGDLIQAISNDSPDLMESQLVQCLSALSCFRAQFEALFKNEKGRFSLETVQKELDLAKNSRIELIYPIVKSEKLGISSEQMASLDGYHAFLEAKYLSAGTTDENQPPKLCYVTGELQSDVQEAGFSDRYNINKIFVKETKNYAPQFDAKAFHQNYQASQQAQDFLDRGSKYVLTHLTTKIAGISHAIVPQFVDAKKLTRKTLDGILPTTDLLFNFRKFETLDFYFHRKSKDEFYWLNFVAIESDGNYFKAANLIKDVSTFHISEMIKALAASGQLLSPWLGKKVAFNLNQMYQFLPVRKDKTQVNPALTLFAAVLEQRKIEERKLFEHFTELILCHWYERYRQFSNVRSKYENFDYAAKDAVFGYLAFRYTLLQLNLLKQSSMQTPTSASESIATNIDTFFDAMQYTPEQRALFYLGRGLSQVAYEQKDKKKTVLDKLNFNGMDKRSIYRLSTDLFEKGTQYDVVDKIKWNLGEFNRRFDFNSWQVNPQEALFFILSGYTYFIQSKPKTEPTTQDEA